MAFFWALMRLGLTVLTISVLGYTLLYGCKVILR
jgi:hypothetical protein